jgi:hypothetical protein
MSDDQGSLAAPYQPPRDQRCARCDDGIITTPGYACCSRCIEAARRAIAAHPGEVITPAMIAAERRA